MSTLEESLRSFILAHRSEFTTDDKQVIRKVLEHMRENEFRAALGDFEAHGRFLGLDFDQASEIISKLHEKTSEPTGAAALAAFGEDETASFKQHVSPESSVAVAPKLKRHLSDNSKKSKQPAKKKRAAPKKPRKKSAFNMFTAGGGKRKDWASVSPEEKARYQALADEANSGKPAAAAPKSAGESK